MRKPTICICENKGADQLRSNCEADQRLCFRYTDSTIPLLSKSKISSLMPSSVLVQPGLCQICSETTLLVFPRGGSNITAFHLKSHSTSVTFRDDNFVNLTKEILPDATSKTVRIVIIIIIIITIV